MRRRSSSFRPSLERLEDRNLLTTWPMPGVHDVKNGFGDGSSFFGQGFIHQIAIRDGDRHDVKVARAGTVLFTNAGVLGGTVTIEVDVGGGNHEWGPKGTPNQVEDVE